MGLPNLPLQSDQSLFDLEDLVSETDTESDSGSDDAADANCREDNSLFGLEDLVSSDGDSDEEVPEHGRGPDLFDPLDTNIEELGDGARLHQEPSECYTARALADVWIESDSDSEDLVELPPTGNVYCLSDAEPDAQPAGPGDRPPTEKHSVATVNTQWKTTTSGYQTIRALCDSGCNGTAIKKWLALAILAVTKGTMTTDRAGEALVSNGTCLHRTGECQAALLGGGHFSRPLVHSLR
jgi:hypothetical protein